MTLVLSGISVSRGVAIGKAAMLGGDDLDIREYTVPKLLVQEEIARFRVALRKARQQLQAIRKRIPANTPADIAGFIDSHLLMLDDGALTEAPIRIIKSRQCNAEWALQLQRDALVQVFDEMEDSYLRTRKDDVDHVVNRIQRNLQERYEQPGGRQEHQLRGAVVIAADVSPAETLLLHQQGVAAVVTERGGPNSHTAILTRSMGLPTVVGVHHLRRYVAKGELLVIDARLGTVTVAPDAAELDFFRGRQRDEQRRLGELKKLRRQPTVTRDGEAVTLMANVEVPEDLPATRRAGAAGIGLFRTEMLFLDRGELPGEDEQFEVYRRVVEAMKGAPVTIRTLDLGADKRLSGNGQRGEAGTNPAMGLRAIRWSLKDPALFCPQLRAILRASAYGRVRLMIPMLSTLGELLQVLRLTNEEKAALQRRGIEFDRSIPVGGMIEVPAAALAAGAFARHLDFLSLGTNDLIQYTLAVDRLDDEVNYLYDPLNPAILKLIRMTIEAGRRAGVPVAMCGEMAGDPRLTRLLLGLGLRELSMYPATLLEVKRAVTTCDAARVAGYARRILKLGTSEEIAALIDRINALD